MQRVPPFVWHILSKSEIILLVLTRATACLFLRLLSRVAFLRGESEGAMARPDKYEYVDHDKPWRYQEGDLTVTRTSAWSGPGCHLGCGILLYTDAEGKLVKVEGDPDNTFNKGRLCPRCLDMIESVYNSDRILYPSRPRSSRRPTWQPTCWPMPRRCPTWRPTR